MSEINYIDPQKVVDKYNPDVVSIKDLTKKPQSEEEKLFVETYLACGNATAAYQKVWPQKCASLKPDGVRARAAQLVKKFNVKGKTKKSIREENKSLINQNNPEMVEYVKKQYEMGLLSEEEMFKRMDTLSKKSTSDQTKFNATKEMRQWVREAKNEIEANKLSQLEVVDLMVDALSELPKAKYVEVLRGSRMKRLKLNLERGIVYNADEIREKQRRDVMFRGAKRRGFEI